MDVPGFVQTLQDSGLAEWMRTSVKAMPIVEAIHVLAAATVFGTILIVDLRLLGFPDTKRPLTWVSNEMLRLTWMAFALALVTGFLMFAANANTYFGNTQFRLKMLGLLFAGLNMALFQGLTYRSVGRWDQGAPTPFAARVAGVLSILLWVTIICLARWVGFTKGYDFDVPQDAEINFQF